MRFVCDGKAYDTNTMELVKLDDFATAIYLDHHVGEAFLQTWDDVIGVRISRMTDDDIRVLQKRFGWGKRRANGEGVASRVGYWRDNRVEADGTGWGGGVEPMQRRGQGHR